MLNEEFFDFLEYQITGALSNSADVEKKRCWCDGVFISGDQNVYSIEEIRKTKKIAISAWIDRGRIKGQQLGQYIYELKIKFGEQSILHFANNQDLRECVPAIENDDWIMLDNEGRKIEIQLL